MFVEGTELPCFEDGLREMLLHIMKLYLFCIGLFWLGHVPGSVSRNKDWLHSCES